MSTTEMQALAEQKYKYGFTTEIEMEAFPRGLNEDIIRLISERKQEPGWLLQWLRLSSGRSRRSSARLRRAGLLRAQCVCS